MEKENKKQNLVKEEIEMSNISKRGAHTHVDLANETAAQIAPGGDKHSQNVNISSNPRKRNKIKSKCSAL